MKKTLKYLLRTLALIMTFGLTAYASDSHFVQHEDSNVTNTAATQPAAGHPSRYNDGHLD